MKSSSYKLITAILLAASALAAAPRNKTAIVIPAAPPTPSKLQTGVATGAALKSAATITTATKPLDLKLLVLTGDGTEPSFGAIKYFLDYLGAPYDAVIAKTAGLPALSDAANSKGIMQDAKL